MAKSARKAPTKGDKHLELIMRDVLTGLSDSACYFAYRSTPDTLEILSIEPPKGDPFLTERTSATVTPLRRARSKDIVDYLVRRETRLERIESTA
ncbi:MAG: hypothetical protein GC149_19035 [Gammaproteobacteria bacterium]|nr:hypothetical protein [Gammaproteobacteria bacterium]